MYAYLLEIQLEWKQVRFLDLLVLRGGWVSGVQGTPLDFFPDTLLLSISISISIKISSHPWGSHPLKKIYLREAIL